MGAGPSTVTAGITEGIAAAAETASEADLKSVLDALTEEERTKIKEALLALKDGDAPPPAAAEQPAEPAMETYGLSDEQVANVRTAFEASDADKSGTIEANELKMIMCALGHDLSDEEIVNILQGLDINGDGKLQFDEYLKMVADALKTVG